jgi:hypothetical protein
LSEEGNWETSLWARSLGFSLMRWVMPYGTIGTKAALYLGQYPPRTAAFGSCKNTRRKFPHPGRRTSPPRLSRSEHSVHKCIRLCPSETGSPPCAQAGPATFASHSCHEGAAGGRVQGTGVAASEGVILITVSFEEDEWPRDQGKGTTYEATVPINRPIIAKQNHLARTIRCSSRVPLVSDEKSDA